MSSQSKSKSSSNKNEELPKGWVVRYSVSRKKDYYFNTITGVSSWNKPYGFSYKDDTCLHNAQSSFDSKSRKTKPSQSYSQNVSTSKNSQQVKPQNETTDCASNSAYKPEVKVKFNVKQKTSLKRPANIFDSGLSNSKTEKGDGIQFVIPKKRKTENKSATCFQNIQSASILQTEKEEKLCPPLSKSFKKITPQNAFPSLPKLPQRSLKKSTISTSESKVINVSNGNSSKAKLKHNLNVCKESSKTLNYTEVVSVRGKLSQGELLRRYIRNHTYCKRSLENEDADHLLHNPEMCNFEHLEKPRNQPKSVVKSTISKAEILSDALSRKPECQSSSSRSIDNNFKLILKDGKMEDIEMEWEDIKNEHVLLNIYEHRKQSMGSSYLEPPEDMEINYFDLSSSENENFIIVLDTNVLLSNMKFVKELSEKEHKGIGRPMLIIPWMVLKELDYMKDNRRNTNSFSSKLKTNARIAIHFINQCFNYRQPFVKGQSAMDDKEELIKVEVPDDSILNCCLQLSKKGNSTILLSNDVNLQNKAMANGILSYGKEKFEEKIQTEKLRQAAIPLKKSANEVHHQEEKEFEGIQQKDILENQHDSYKSINLFSELKTIMNIFFSNLLKNEMKRVFEDMWLKVVFIKPPWMLLDTLKCIDKHWCAVFSFIMCKSARNNIEKLLNFFKNPPSDPTSNDIEKITEYGLGICRAVSLKEHKELVSEHQQKFEEILNKLSQKESNAIPNVGDHSTEFPVNKDSNLVGETGKDVVFEAFQIALSLVNNFCGTVCDTIGVEYGIAYQKPETFPSVDEINQRLPHVSEYVAKLTNSMSSVLETPMSLLSPQHPAIVNLQASLLAVISSDFQVSHTISCESLLSFALEGHTRIMLTNGVKQFSEFQMALLRLASYLAKPK